MTLRVSTKFKDLILGPTAFETIFNGGRILVYSGAQPTSADAAIAGVLLGQITANGLAWAAGGSDGGLTFERSNGVVRKAAAQPWKLTVSATGVAGWFRLVGRLEDSGGQSYAAPRIDGSVGTSSLAQLVLGNPSLTAGDVRDIPQFLYSIPPLGA